MERLNRFRYLIIIVCMAVIWFSPMFVKNKTAAMVVTIIVMLIGLAVLVMSAMYRLKQQRK
ncbi:hypothetical protein A374_14110 [Fictibacillus macauensis ZFHKF-1]|uniref:Uncharacterized protein n=1 Tax=Fictibacillus macauensis ZFHKF-1 TaxID=1196324 RepID=I8AGM5_9BACL|nr:hypothetical protein [Fictibacillus macauensis]EIT84832.1 hypothetical protein A374_14110 [Fictibacillus macauensis ZFHKF-1]